MQQSLDRYFAGSKFASEVSEIPPDVLESDPEGNWHILRSGSEFRLSVLIDTHGKIPAFDLSFRAFFVHRERTGSARWGGIVNDVDQTNPHYKRSSLVGAASRPPKEDLWELLRLVTEIRQLNHRQQTWLVEQIRDAVSSK